MTTLEKLDGVKVYEKADRETALNNAKNRREQKKLADQAEKTKNVADAADKAASTANTAIATKIEAKEVDTDTKAEQTVIESQAARIEELIKEIETLKAANKELADKIDDSNKKLGEANDTINVMKEQIESQKPLEDLTSSARMSTEVKTNVGALQQTLISHVKTVTSDVQIANEICKNAYKGDQKEFFTEFGVRIEGYLKLHNECQAEFERNAVILSQAIERRNSMACHGNSNKIYLQTSDQSGKFLSLFNYFHPKLTNLIAKIKELQNNYETFAKDEFRDAEKFKELVDSLVKSSTQIEDAQTKYRNQDEVEKNDLLKKNYLRLSNTLDEIKKLKTELDKIPEDKKLSDIKYLFSQVEKEIEKTQKEVPDSFAADYSIHSEEVKKGIKKDLTENNKHFNSVYLDMRKWASPLWNEIINTIKILETELQLLGERSLLHDIQGSFNVINAIKGNSNEDCESLKNSQPYDVSRHKEDLRLWNNEQTNIRKWHVQYTKLTDGYQSSINDLEAKIKDVKAEGALKGLIDEYAINDFSKKDTVVAELIKTLTKQKELITQQKALVDKKWGTLTQRILDTGNNLCVIDAGSYAKSFITTNAYRPFYNELIVKPVVKKDEKVAEAAKT